MNKPRIIEEYEINPHTMMIQPYEYGSKTYSKIYEMEETLLSPFKPLDIIKNSCALYGSSYEGRKEGTRKLTGIYYKPPIALDTHTSMYLLPTTSPTKENCIWLSHSLILTHNKTENGNANVVFKNLESFILPISYSSFLNQYQRTARLRLAHVEKISEITSKYFVGEIPMRRKPKRKHSFYLVKNNKKNRSEL